MKLKELVEQYGEYDVVLSKREATNEILIEGRKPKLKTVWDLGIREIYYDLHSDGQIHPLRYEGKESDEKRILTGSAFLTKEEAKQEVERRKVETLLLKHGGRRWFKDDSGTGEKMNWYIFYGYDISVGWGGARQGTIYFDTKEQAQKAVKEIGEERIKNALFEVR